MKRPEVVQRAERDRGQIERLHAPRTAGSPGGCGKWRRKEGSGMNMRVTGSTDGDKITIHIPMTFMKRGGRKLVITPDGTSWSPRPRVDNAMVKALARAFRWQRMLDDGVCATIEELAKRERVNRGYMSRVLRLTLLAPDFVEAILDGRQPEGMRWRIFWMGFHWTGRSNQSASGGIRHPGGAPS
jgi:hypothetical protein